jgi:protein SCO1/2
MATITRRQWLATTTGLFSLAGARAALGAVPAAERPSTTARAALQRRHLPNVRLHAHDGRWVRFYDDLVKDRVVLINLMYAQCQGICPGITANLARVQRLLGKRAGRDVFIYSITIKPEEDDVRALRRYARAHGAGPGWLFLTGAPTDIELLRRSLGFVDPDPAVDRDKSNHIGNIRYGNEARMFWAACPGGSKAEGIVKAITSLETSRRRRRRGPLAGLSARVSGEGGGAVADGPR